MEKKRLAKLLNLKSQLKKDNAIAYFKPHCEKQLEFFKHADCRRRAIFAGNRFGKSTIGAAEVVSWLLGERRFFPKESPLRTLGIPEGGVKILCIAEDWDRVGELFTNSADHLDKPGKLMEFLPTGVEWKPHKNQNGHIDAIYVTVERNRIKRKSAVFFDTVKSFKNNPLSAESLDWDFIHIDEPIPEAMYRAISRGLIDRDGFVMALLTPITEPWLYHMFVERAAEGVAQGGYWWTNASMDDNPFLTEEAKEEYLRNLDPIEKECRRRGIPTAMGNLVISTYEEKKHLWDVEARGIPHGWVDAYTPPPDYLCHYAIDTHPQTPTAVLFVAIAPTGQVFFYDELWIGGIEKDRMSHIAKEIKLRTSKVRLGHELCEPGAWSSDPETGRSFADVFIEHGLYIEKASKERSFAIRQTRILFASDRKVFIMSHMRNLRKELRRWYFTKENKPADKDDHFCECLGRLIVHDDLIYYEQPATSPLPQPDAYDLGELLKEDLCLDVTYD